MSADDTTRFAPKHRMLAAASLVQVAGDQSAPANARVQAAKILKCVPRRVYHHAAHVRRPFYHETGTAPYQSDWCFRVWAAFDPIAARSPLPGLACL